MIRLSLSSLLSKFKKVTTDRFDCKHKWRIVSDYRERTGTGALPSVLNCKKCGVNLSAHEAAEIALWKNTIGVQKWISIGSFVISVGALIVSIVVLNITKV